MVGREIRRSVDGLLSMPELMAGSPCCLLCCARHLGEATELVSIVWRSVLTRTNRTGAVGGSSDLTNRKRS